jgi:serine/threonine protein kinase
MKSDNLTEIFKRWNCRMQKDLIEQHGFKLIAQIDQTLHTEVWKAIQVELDRTVCLQILKPEAAQNPVELEHFLMIARIFAKVKSDAVAAVFDIVSTPKVHYVVMEFVDGPTVGSLVKNGHRISEEHILQIGTALAHCFDQLWHKDHLIHRNLKGDTVQIDQRGVAKLTDFSLAITTAQDLSVLDNGNIVGTPSFIAPEYAQGVRTLTTQADMYSFGALMYQLATGHAPFASLPAVEALSAQVREQITPPHKLNKQISLGFSWFVHRLMMKNPNNRYPDWHAVLQDIHLLTRGELPNGIETEEQFFSTIDSKPLVAAMEGLEDDDPEDISEEVKPKGHRVKVKSSVQAISQFEEEHNRDVRRSANQFVTFMLFLLLVWFVGLFWYRGVFEPEKERIAKAMALKKEVVVPPTHVTVVPKEHVQKKPSEPPPVTPTPNIPPKPEVTPEPKPEPKPEIPQPPPEPPMPDSLRQTLVTAAKAGDLAAMRAALENEPSHFRGKERMAKMLRNTPEIGDLIERTMASKLDQSISFLWRGKARVVVPRSVTSSSVTLEANGRQQEINFSDLTPDEMISLTSKPHADAESLSYCLLLLKSTQKSELPQYARRCPAFQDILLQALNE